MPLTDLAAVQLKRPTQLNIDRVVQASAVSMLAGFWSQACWD